MERNDSLSQFKLLPSKSDIFIYNSEIFSTLPPMIFSSITPYMIPIKTSLHLYNINLRYIYSSSDNNLKNPTIIYLHGHGSSCTWATWLKIAFLLFLENFNGILIDLPGYGKSTIEGESRVNPKLYMNDAGTLLTKLLALFFSEGKNFKTIGIGFCGGAANLIRTISEYPEYFAKKHVFHNCVIGQIPENFEKNIEKFKMKVWVSWHEDIDHAKACVGYKWFNKKRKEGCKRIFLQDIGEEELSSYGMWSKDMGRKTSNVMIFEPSLGYMEFVKAFLNLENNNNDKIPIYKVVEKNYEEDLMEKIKELSLKEAEEINKDLEKVLALSLKEK